VTETNEQEVIPYDVLLATMENELHRRDSQIVMLNARLKVRDQTITQLRAQLAAAGGQSAPSPGTGARMGEDLGQQHVELPPPADQQPVPEG
jgi:hypothetical protein